MLNAPILSVVAPLKWAESLKLKNKNSKKRLRKKDISNYKRSWGSYLIKKFDLPC